uniref:Protein kinase domain-containing protein n=1 Tax=Oxyrrhis marina TaxID=2969 RepID=A0A7S4GPP9_OXYMA
MGGSGALATLCSFSATSVPTSAVWIALAALALVQDPVVLGLAHGDTEAWGNAMSEPLQTTTQMLIVAVAGSRPLRIGGRAPIWGSLVLAALVGTLPEANRAFRGFSTVLMVSVVLLARHSADVTASSFSSHRCKWEAAEQLMSAAGSAIARLDRSGNVIDGEYLHSTLNTQPGPDALLQAVEPDFVEDLVTRLRYCTEAHERLQIGMVGAASLLHLDMVATGVEVLVLVSKPRAAGGGAAADLPAAVRRVQLSDAASGIGADTAQLGRAAPGGRLVMDGGTTILRTRPASSSRTRGGGDTAQIVASQSEGSLVSYKTGISRTSRASYIQKHQVSGEVGYVGSDGGVRKFGFAIPASCPRHAKKLEEEAKMWAWEDFLADHSEVDFTGSKLGAGTFAQVHEAVFRGGVAAVKVFSEVFKKELRREIAIMTMLSRMDHAHLCHLLALTQAAPTMLVMELCKGGTLKDAIRRPPGAVDAMDWRQRLIALDQVCGALCHIHHHDIIHRDLKSNNILLMEPVSTDSAPWAKLADVGLACLDNMGTAAVAGDREYYWHAPEMRTEEQTTAVDMYSFGMLLFEVFVERFPGATDLQALALMHEAPAPGVAFLACAATVPAERPTAQQLKGEMASWGVADAASASGWFRSAVQNRSQGAVPPPPPRLQVPVPPPPPSQEQVPSPWEGLADWLTGGGF